MKNLAAIVVILFVFASCGKSETPEPPPDPTSPKLESFSPSTGRFNSEVTIRGNNFSTTLAANQVKFGNITAIIVSANSTELKVLVPVGAINAKISVTVNGKTTVSANDFTVLSPIAWSVNTAFTGETVSRAATFATSTRGFLIGGRNFLGDYKKEVWSFDMVSNTWTRKNDFPGAGRNNSLGFEANGRLFLFGGENGQQGFVDLWEYNPNSDQWIQKKTFPGELRSLANGFSIGGKIYVGSGIDFYNQVGGQFKPLVDFWEYDIATDSWTRKKDFPGGCRWQAINFSVGGKGYLGSGPDYDKQLKTDFWEYDPVADNWTRKADFPSTARGVTFNAVVGSNAYVIGGSAITNNLLSIIAYREVWMYNPSTNTWSLKEEYPGSGQMSLTGFSNGSKIYMGFGSNEFSNIFKDFWTFDPIK